MVISYTLPTSLPEWGHGLGPAILGIDLTPPNALWFYKVCILVFLIHFWWLLPSASLHTPLLETSPWSPIPRKLRPIPCHRPSPLLSPQYFLRSFNEITLIPPSLNPSPHSFCSNTVAQPRLPNHASLIMLWLVPLYYPSPLPPSLISYGLFIGCCIFLPSQYYWMQLCDFCSVIMWLSWVGLHWPWKSLGFLQSTAAMSHSVFCINVPSRTLQCLNGNCLAAMV